MSLNSSHELSQADGDPGLWAISDLHVRYAQNQDFVAGLKSSSRKDWLIVCGDVGEVAHEVISTLSWLRDQFQGLIWVPGNHELWTTRDDPISLRGLERYWYFVEQCRRLEIVTPEDPYPIWPGRDGPIRLLPLFILYDYSFGQNIGKTKDETLRRAYDSGIVCADEFLLHPDPFASREEWCWARVTETQERLKEAADGMASILINHFPLIQEPTLALRHPEFAQWCGTIKTARWHLDFSALAVVYGHLHIPRTSFHDGVRFEEVSLGYPREWGRRTSVVGLRRIF